MTSPQVIAAALLIAVCAAPAAGRDFHVACQDSRASDANDGSAAAPWRTVSHAAQTIQPGDTAWIHGGVYREVVVFDRSGTGPDKMLSFRAMPGETATISGGEVLHTWSRSPSESTRQIWETDWPYAGLFPGMVAADSRPLIPLNVPAATEDLKPPKQYCQFFLGFGRGQDKMFPGSFLYDEPRKKLLVWLKGDEDPRAHLMETAVRGAWDSRGNYILVEGLHFQFCPLVVPVGGVVFVMTGPGGGGSPAEGCIVRNCEISLGAFEGIRIRGGARVTTLVEDCWVHHNGCAMGGIEGLALPDTDSWIVARRCRFTDNNIFNWNPSWHAGSKSFGTRIFFDRCEFARNYNSPGCWFDIHERDCIVNRCRAHDNGMMGIYYEIGETGAFINNVVEGNGFCAGLMFAGSSRSLMANNAISNYEAGIYLGGEGRADGKISRITCHDRAYNNLIVGRGRPMINLTSDSDMATDNLSDNNLLWQEGMTAAQMEADKLFEGGKGRLTLAEWRKTRGLDLATRLVDPGAHIDGKACTVTRRPGGASLSGGRRFDLAALRDIFAVRPMPTVESESGSSSIAQHQPASEAFVRKVAELLAVPRGKPVPIGPLPDPEGTVTVPVANADFEASHLDVNGTTSPVPGWTITGAGDRPGLVWHAGETPVWNWYCPSGVNVLALVANARAEQILPTKLQPNTRYELSAWTGQRVDHEKLPWPKVALSLFAGGQLLNTIDVPEPLIWPHHGIWVQVALTYTSPDRVEPNRRLRVVLTRDGDSAAWACFDSVSLTATPLASGG